MRDKLARDFDEAPPAVVAQIAGRLSAILVELEELGAEKKVSTLDELGAKRSSRFAEAGVPDATGAQGRQRGRRSS
jgi:hypothetical protein